MFTETKSLQYFNKRSLDDIVLTIYRGNLDEARDLLATALYRGIQHRLDTRSDDWYMDLFDLNSNDNVLQDQLYALEIFNKVLPGYFNWKEIKRTLKNLLNLIIPHKPNQAKCPDDIGSDIVDRFLNSGLHTMGARVVTSLNTVFPDVEDLLQTPEIDFTPVAAYLSHKLDPVGSDPYYFKILSNRELAGSVASLSNSVHGYLRFPEKFLILNLYEKSTDKLKYNVVIDIKKKTIIKVLGKFKHLPPSELLGHLHTRILPVNLEVSYFDRKLLK